MHRLTPQRKTQSKSTRKRAFSIGGEGVEDAADAEVFIKNGNRVYIHLGHAFNNACANCGEEQGSDLTASTLSEGSLVIVVGIAAAVVFGLGGFFLGRKKKKPALADGKNTDEE